MTIRRFVLSILTLLVAAPAGAHDGPHAALHGFALVQHLATEHPFIAAAILVVAILVVASFFSTRKASAREQPRH